MTWDITITKKPTLTNAILIEGLPGIGNVGKVVVDYLIDQSKAKKIASFFSPALPNSVFVTEENLVELPKIEVYHATIKGQDYLLMTGDVQPADEQASYSFCQAVIAQAARWHVEHIITLGGIGLQEEPETPAVYCTGNDKDYIQTFADHGAKTDVYGTVGPIIGVSGLLLGLSEKPAATLLAETLGHPMYLGLKGAKSLLELLKKRFDLDFDLKEIDDEIDAMEDDEEEPKNPEAMTKLKRHKKDMSYIG